MDEKNKTKLINETLWLATTESVDKAMCSLSKPFYDEKFKDLNYHVDGRQMGSAEVTLMRRSLKAFLLASTAR